MVPDVGISSFRPFEWRRVAILYLFYKTSGESQTWGHGTFSPREISHRCLPWDIKTSWGIPLQNMSWSGTFSKSSGAVGLFCYLSTTLSSVAHMRFQLGASEPNSPTWAPIHPVSTTDQVSGNVKQASKPWQIQQIFQKPLLSKQQLRHHNELIKQTARKNAQSLNREKRMQLIITFVCVCVTHLQLRRLDKAICPLGKCVQSLLTVQRNTIRQWCWFVGNLMSAHSLHEAVRVGPTSLTAAITPYEPVSAQTSISGPLGAVGRLWCSV